MVLVRMKKAFVYSFFFFIFTIGLRKLFFIKSVCKNLLLSKKKKFARIYLTLLDLENVENTFIFTSSIILIISFSF